MILPMVLPIATHLPRQTALIRRRGWTPDRTGTVPDVRILEIEILSDAEETALRAHLPGLNPRGAL